MSEYKPKPWDDEVAEWMKANAAPDIVPLGPEMVWFDIETTGIEPEENVMLEVACMVTDRYGYVLGSFETLVRDTQYRPGETRSKAVPFVQEMHDKSGLWDEIDNASTWEWGMGEAHDQLEQFIGQYFPLPRTREQLIPIAGSSVHFDRGWINYYMPGLLSLYFNHRDIDVSSTKEQIKLHNPDLLKHLPEFWTPIGAHRGTPDLIDSIMEYRFQIAEFFWTRENAEGFGTDLTA